MGEEGRAGVPVVGTGLRTEEPWVPGGGAPEALRLGGSRGVPARGQAAEHSPATVGSVSSHCWQLQ